jgi:hypothetical protein
MPRPTLKLPKTSASGNAAEPNRSPARKPLRGGAAASKRAGSRPTDSRPQPTAKPSRTATGDTPPQAPQPTPAETTSPSSDRPSVVSTAPRDREDRPGRALREKFSAPAAADRARKSSKKIHPPRGIARSTGARAFRPAPENTDSEPSLPPAGTYGKASPSEARRAPPPPRRQQRRRQAARRAAWRRSHRACRSWSASWHRARDAKPTNGSRTAGSASMAWSSTAWARA